MRQDQIISIVFSLIALILVFSAKTGFGGEFVGFDFSWLGIKWGYSPFLRHLKKANDDECRECYGKGWVIIGDNVIECSCTEGDENEK